MCFRYSRFQRCGTGKLVTVTNKRREWTPTRPRLWCVCAPHSNRLDQSIRPDNVFKSCDFLFCCLVSTGSTGIPRRSSVRYHLCLRLDKFAGARIMGNCVAGLGHARNQVLSEDLGDCTSGARALQLQRSVAPWCIPTLTERDRDSSVQGLAFMLFEGASTHKHTHSQSHGFGMSNWHGFVNDWHMLCFHVPIV